jgi:hypothetical protein
MPYGENLRRKGEVIPEDRAWVSPNRLRFVGTNYKE